MEKKIYISLICLLMISGVFGIINNVEACPPSDCDRYSARYESQSRDVCLQRCTDPEPTAPVLKPSEPPPETSASDSANNGNAVTLGNPLGQGVTIDDLIKKFILSILGFSGVLALIAFVYGGIFWLISMGDPNKITKGKNIMIWAVFGLVIIFGSYAIISTIYTVLGIK